VSGLAAAPPEDLLAFVRARTAPAPVPLAPELVIHQASELTPLWKATTTELAGAGPVPFWAFPWAGGQALARHLLDHPELVRGRTVFDFATGSGLVALAAARAGAARVVACDVDPFAAAAAGANAALAGVTIEVRLCDPIGEALPGFDLVTAGDIFYERPLAEAGLAWLRRLAAAGARVLAGDPGRNYSPTEGVVELARYEVPTTLEIEGAPVRTTSVLDVLPEAAPAAGPPDG
jgi:predicted nicotinamide N-methyase